MKAVTSCVNADAERTGITPSRQPRLPIPSTWLKLKSDVLLMLDRSLG